MMVTTVWGFVNYELRDLIAISTNFDNISLHGAVLGLKSHHALSQLFYQILLLIFDYYVGCVCICR